nr:hypothetical protein GCM10020063_019190 [Dactylosporangium thailandense]
MVGYGAWSLVLIALYLVLPDSAVGLVWIAVTATTVTAVLLGVRRNRPRRRWPWRLLGLTYVTFLAGSILSLASPGFPSMADAWSSTSVSDKQLALVRGIVRLAAILQMSVVAEGVETPADDELLRDMGCRFGQGYLYAKPMPEPAEWVQAHAVNA